MVSPMSARNLQQKMSVFEDKPSVGLSSPSAVVGGGSG